MFSWLCIKQIYLQDSQLSCNFDADFQYWLKSKRSSNYAELGRWDGEKKDNTFMTCGITINVPVVYMGRYKVGLRGGLSITRGILGVGRGPKNLDFFGPLNGTSVASAIWAQKQQVHWLFYVPAMDI
jgi:hypothetical protein